MATITIQSLSSEQGLLLDEESLLNEVGMEDLANVNGGVSPFIVTAAVIFTGGYGFGYAVGRLFK